MLTRKTYEVQAAIIAKHVEAGKVERDHLYEMATDLANYYAKDNPRFGRGRFFEACGFPAGNFSLSGCGDTT